MSILKSINKEVQDFKSKNIQIVPGLWFNQWETLQKIFFYYNSKYTTGDIDDEGDRKYFYNIVKNPCKVFSKAIDFDTKNIRLITAGGGDPLKTWFMERDVKYWMRDKQFGKVLNRIFRELPIFGTVVIKIIDGEPFFVDLRNFIVTQSADNLRASNFITEIHNYTPTEFRKVAKGMKGWKQADVDKVIEEYYKMRDTSHIRLYERYGDVPDENGKYTYRRVFLADVGIDELDNLGNLVATHPGVELSSEEWDIEDTLKTYWEFHAEKMSGRWLGIGVVETLFEPQIRQNELANLQTKTSYWASLRIFQTRDSTVNRNMMTDVRNGEVLNCDSEITQVDMSDRNLAFFSQETDKWLRNRDELTFSYDVVQGERLPAGTPLGSAQLAVSQTLSYFEGIQENVALDVKEMLYGVILPQFEKDNTAEHTIRLVGQDLDTYIGLIRNQMVLKEVMRLALKGKWSTQHDADVIGIAIEESVKQGKEKILTVPKGFYKDVKYDIDIDITGESVDTRVRAATKFAILQAVTADPSMLQDPVKKKLLMTYAEDGGFNLAEILGTESKKPDEVSPPQQANPIASARAGGGVSAPQLGARIPGQQTATV